MNIQLTERRARLHLMSDDQYARELLAQKRVTLALDELKAAIEYVNDASVLVRIDKDAFPNFVHDEIPDEETWNEAIVRARG